MQMPGFLLFSYLIFLGQCSFVFFLQHIFGQKAHCKMVLASLRRQTHQYSPMWLWGTKATQAAGSLIFETRFLGTRWPNFLHFQSVRNTKRGRWAVQITTLQRRAQHKRKKGMDTWKNDSGIFVPLALLANDPLINQWPEMQGPVIPFTYWHRYSRLLFALVKPVFPG